MGQGGVPGDSRGDSGLQEVLQAQREHPPPLFRPHPALLPTAEAGAGQAPWEEAVSLAPCPPVQGWTGRGRSHAWRYKRQPGHRGNELSLSLAAGRWQQAYSALQPSLRAPSPPWSPCPPPYAPSLWPSSWPCTKVSSPGLSSCSSPEAVCLCLLLGLCALQASRGAFRGRSQAAWGLQEAVLSEVLPSQGSHRSFQPRAAGASPGWPRAPEP